MKYWKLRGRIAEKFGTCGAFAEAMKMHPSTLSAKLSGRVEWTRQEMETAGTLLDIPVEEIHLYFFTS
jgi:hypothetical protein